MSDKRKLPPKPPPYTLEELSDKVDELEDRLQILSSSNEALMNIVASTLRYLDNEKVIHAKAMLIFLAETSHKIEDPICAMALKTMAQQILVHLQLLGLHSSEQEE